MVKYDRHYNDHGWTMLHELESETTETLIRFRIVDSVLFTLLIRTLIDHNPVLDGLVTLTAFTADHEYTLYYQAYDPHRFMDSAEPHKFDLHRMQNVIYRDARKIEMLSPEALLAQIMEADL